VDPLVEALRDEDARVRSYAACALGEIGDPRAVDPLIYALQDEDEESDVRSGAARALGEIGDPRAVDPLVEALQDEDENVRLRAAWALGEIGDARAIEPLTHMDSSGTLGFIHVAATQALEKIEAKGR
jgi:HEAT repeat protein